MLQHEDLSQNLVLDNSCNFCNEKNFSEWGEKGALKLVECNMCGLVFINPKLNGSGLSAFHTEHNQERVNDTENNEKRKKMFRLERDFLLKHIKNQKSILDIGCGGGGFLQGFSDKFKKIGTEYDPASVKEAENKGIKCYRGDFIDLEITENEFDIIIFRGVIEHVLDPKKTLYRASELLAENGLLLITSTPNLSSVCAEVYRENWNQVGPDHLYYFNEPLLSGVLSQKSVKLIDETHFYEETPYGNHTMDFNKLKTDLMRLRNGQVIVDTSPPYWGNMLSLIYKKC